MFVETCDDLSTKVSVETNNVRMSAYFRLHTFTNQGHNKPTQGSRMLLASLARSIN